MLDKIFCSPYDKRRRIETSHLALRWESAIKYCPSDKWLLEFHQSWPNVWNFLLQFLVSAWRWLLDAPYAGLCHTARCGFVSSDRFSVWDPLDWLSKQKACQRPSLPKAEPFGKGCGSDSSVLRRAVHRDGFRHPVLTSGSRVPWGSANEPVQWVRCWERAACAPACLLPQPDSSVVELNLEAVLWEWAIKWHVCTGRWLVFSKYERKSTWYFERWKVLLRQSCKKVKLIKALKSFA